MSPVRLVVGREISTRVQQKSFRIGLGVTLFLIALVASLPRFIGGSGSDTYDIAVNGSNADAIGTSAQALAEQQGDEVVLHPVESTEQAEEMIRAGTWDAALVDGAIVAESSTSTAAELLNSAYRAVTGSERLADAGVSAEVVAQALAVEPLPVTSTRADTTERQTIATIAIVALFAQLIGFCSWVATGVVEEKSSRVVELVLSAVRPWQLLAGKLFGIGAIAIGQLVTYAVVGLGVAATFGQVELPPGTVGAVAISVGWFVLAFGFFAALSAALGSLVSRQEEVSGVLAPVTALLMISYALGFAAIGSPDSTLARVVSFIPPISSITMPARIIRGGVPAVEVIVSILLMLAVTVAVLAVGAKIYRAAVLQTGSKLGLQAVWRAEAAADLD